ncbi:FAD-dependent oxidoreductase [Nitrosopumilus ureiphilus]|uniref:FAD-dependent oxidoreductase n=1 Tax=Nitrosopumilus ureiphilus TaxID=1470067 RepID=UPI0015CD6BA0|nr:FAD-dependent oxidoreductase [Nitrosopumilus ureiphilus]
MTQDEKFDVAIIGGGPAGCATALSLLKYGYSVVIMEKTDYNNLRVGEILPPKIQVPLSYLGIWKKFLNENNSSPSFTILSSWGKKELHENNFIFNPFGKGWHVNRCQFDAFLAHASESAGSRLYLKAKLVSFNLEDNNWKLKVACDNKLYHFKSRFLIDATGHQSAISLQFNANKIVHDKLIGIVCYLSPNSKMTSDNHLLIEAAECGWWYSAILPDQNIVVAYMTDADIYKHGIKKSTTFWNDELQKTIHTKSRLSSYPTQYILNVYSASSFHLDKVSGKGWLAVGDAAIAFDPLSSQGVWKSLQTGIHAAEAIKKYLENKENPLEEYSTWINKIFCNYLLERQKFYSSEKRWPDSDFWKRRN